MECETVKQIQLTQGKVALVDAEDFERLSSYKWFANKNSKSKDIYYAAAKPYRNGRRITIMMHRVILNAPEGSQVDHKNHDGLDNRKANLRFCTPSQNHQNRRFELNTTSKYKGVCYSNRTLKWRAYIQDKGNWMSLGSFDDEVEAARAYDHKAKELFGEFAHINFPEDNDEKKNRTPRQGKPPPTSEKSETQNPKRFSRRRNALRFS